MQDSKKRKVNRQKSHYKGLFGEQYALFWLRVKGYRCLNKRFKTPVGEIDLIMRKGKTICFIEVKHYMKLEQAAQSINNKQKKRISRTASLWMQQNTNYASYTQRFDALLLHGKGLTLRVKHIQNAWYLDELGV